MAFTLHPAGLDDVEDVARIFQDAFKDDRIMSHFYPNTPAAVIRAKDVKFFQEQIGQGDVYGKKYTKVVEVETGRTVAFSAWQYPYTLTPEQSADKADKDAMAKKATPPVEGANGPLIAEFLRQLGAGKERWVVPDKTFFLHILAVSPAYHRLGIGSRLIRSGLEAADAAGAQTYIAASQMGLPLYMRYGWEPVGEMVIEMGKYGGQGVERESFLMREANAPSKIGRLVDS